MIIHEPAQPTTYHRDATTGQRLNGLVAALVVILLSLSMWSLLSIVPEPAASEVEQPTCIYLNEGE